MVPGPNTSPPPPVNMMLQPPAKRPKLAPNPMSPPPMSSFPSSPMSMSQVMPPQQQQQQHQQQYQQAASSMPPPSAPASKPTDPSDLADALTSAGIDLKEEEARLASFSSGGNSASGSFTSDQYGPQNGSFGPGGIASEEELFRRAQRRQAEARAFHFENPFLDPRILSNRLFRKTKAEHCREFSLSNGQGQVVTSGQQADVATLISLACKERVSALVTRAMVLAKSRRRAQNVVTGEWAEIVKGYTPDNAKPDSAVSPRGNPLKRSFSSANNIPPTNLTAQQTTLINETAKALRALQQKEFSEEQAFIEKKTRRQQLLQLSGIPGSTPSTPAASIAGGGEVSTPSTPTYDPGSGQFGGGDRRLSGKESRRQHASKIEEAASHRAANATANMMMGGGKKKKYSWMSGVGGGGGSGGMAGGGASRGMAGGIPGISIDAATNGNMPGDMTGQHYWNGGQRIGAWRDDGERGLGIQIRDWAGALEDDGRGVKRGVVKAYMKMK